jgi:hypothetical protein
MAKLEKASGESEIKRPKKGNIFRRDFLLFPYFEGLFDVILQKNLRC